MKKALLYIFLISISFLFEHCIKLPYGHVTFRGRLLNYVTKTPIQGSIYVCANTERGMKHSVDMGQATTGFDGTFSCMCSFTHGPYFVYIEPNDGGIFGSRDFTMKMNAIKDFGELFGGKYTFLCKVNLNPVSSNAIDFPFLETGALHFNAGTSTQFIAKQTLAVDEFHNTFNLRFDTNGVSSGISIPISNAALQDTLSTTINY